MHFQTNAQVRFGENAFALAPYSRGLLTKTLLVMKLTAILLLAVVIQVSAKVSAQTVTYIAKNEPITKVFAEIKRQTGYSLFYRDQDVRNVSPVTVFFEDVEVNIALETLLNDKPLTFVIEENAIFIKPKIRALRPPAHLGAPPITVRGRVVDEKRHPVVVNIQVKGTRAGLTTTDNGEFELKGIKEDAVLIISGVNIETFEVRVGSRKDLGTITAKIKIAEGEAVTIVNTGYQKIPKERATGSFTTISNTLFNQQVGTDVLSRLQYITDGLTVLPQQFQGNSRTGLTIRGLSTFAAARDPLIIIDNFPYNGSLQNINPNDILTINLLKDAAAASIWGAKAGNGVIVITTKSGRQNQPLKIEVNANLTMTRPPDLFQLQNMSSSELIDVEKFLFDTGFYDFRFPYPSFYSLTPIVTILRQQQLGELSPAEAESRINALRNIDVRNEYDKFFYKNGINQQYALNLSGGSDNHFWYLSGGVDRNYSVLDEKYFRQNFRFFDNYELTKKMQLSANIMYTSSKSESGRPAYGSVNPSRMPQYTKLADDQGNPLPLYTFRSYRQGYIDTLGGGKLLDWKYYPLEDYQHAQDKLTLMDMNADIGINYKLLSSLNIDVRYRYQNQHAEHTLYQDMKSFYVRDIINAFSQLDYTSGTINYIVPKGGVFDITNETSRTQDARAQANFSQVWGHHELSAIAGAQLTQELRQDNTQRWYGFDEDIYSSAPVDYTRAYPHFINQSESFIENPASVNKKRVNFISYYSNLSYTYKTRYTISASARRDASNLFGVETKNKWRPLWSVGGSWNVSNETFYRSSQVPYLKLRATYGISGNVIPEQAALTTIRYVDINPYTQSNYARIETIYNPKLTWEQVGMLNIGVDFASKNSRISGNLEFYQKKMKDLYGAKVIDPTTGLGRNIVANHGGMKGDGLDLHLNGIITVAPVRWSADIIVNYYADKVMKLYDKEGLMPASIVGGSGGVGLEGYPLYAYFAYKWGGLDPQTGDPLGYLDKELSKDYASILSDGTTIDDLAYIGRVIPKWYGSLGNSWQWKNLALTVRLTYKLGYYFKRSSILYERLYNENLGHPDYAQRWQQPGDELRTNVPAMVYPVESGRDDFYNLSEALAEKADNIRVQYLNLQYNFGRPVLSRLGVDKLQLYAVANNVAMIWKANRVGLDPDFLNMPAQRSYSLGARCTF